MSREPLPVATKIREYQENQMFLNQWKVKQVVVHPRQEILLSNKKGTNY